MLTQGHMQPMLKHTDDKSDQGVESRPGNRETLACDSGVPSLAQLTWLCDLEQHPPQHQSPDNA